MRQGKHRSRIGPRQKILRFDGIEFCGDNGVVDDARLVGWGVICLPRPDTRSAPLHYDARIATVEKTRPGMVRMSTFTN